MTDSTEPEMPDTVLTALEAREAHVGWLEDIELVAAIEQASGRTRLPLAQAMAYAQDYRAGINRQASDAIAKAYASRQSRGEQP